MVSARQRERLSTIRAKGRKTFIWRQGVLGLRIEELVRAASEGMT